MVGPRRQLMRHIHEALRKLAPKFNVLAVAVAVWRLFPATSGYCRLGTGARYRVRDRRRQQRLDEGGLLEAARHESAEYLDGPDTEAVNGTVPWLVAHLVLALDDGHFERARHRQQAARIVFD